MIHLFCRVNGIKDTTKKGKYHNDKFKAECLKRGLEFKLEEADKKLGWYKPLLTEEAVKQVEGYGIDPEAFKLARKVPQKEKKKKPSYKYTCPVCEASFTIKKHLNLSCTDCDNQEMEVEIK